MSAAKIIAMLILNWYLRIAKIFLVALILVGTYLGLQKLFHESESPDWRGTYVFEEKGGMGKLTINVLGDSKDHMNAIVSIENGPRGTGILRCYVNQSASASGEIHQASIDLDMPQTGADVVSKLAPTLKDGATLFILEREGDVLFTRWFFLSPTNRDHDMPGVWFVKTS
jgi:hypothetical protein